MRSNSTYLPAVPLVAALAILVGLMGAPAGAENFTYKQKQQCTDVAAQDARQVGSAGTPDPATARAMKAVGLMNGPSWRQDDGWIVGHIWSAPTEARRICDYVTDYSEREVTRPGY